MNDVHLELCSSELWKDLLRDMILPWVLGDGAVLRDGGDDVLEVGPGPGMTTDLLRPQVRRLTAVELDPGLAAALAERTAGTNVEVVNADATAMPFPDDRFTAAVSFTMLHHVPTAELQDRLFAEVARVLRPGARYAVSDSVASADLEALHDDDTYNPVDPATLPDRLAAAGFTAVELRTNDFAWTATATAG